MRWCVYDSKLITLTGHWLLFRQREWAVSTVHGMPILYLHIMVSRPICLGYLARARFQVALLSVFKLSLKMHLVSCFYRAISSDIVWQASIYICLFCSPQNENIESYTAEREREREREREGDARYDIQRYHLKIKMPVSLIETVSLDCRDDSQICQSKQTKLNDGNPIGQYPIFNHKFIQRGKQQKCHKQNTLAPNGHSSKTWHI